MLDVMFLQVLESSQAVTPDVLRSAYVCASEMRNEKLLITLAARADLPDDVDAEIALIDRATVRAAWISRPGRTAEAISDALAREKRATVLAAVVKSPTATPDLLLAISRDQRRVVALAMLENEAAPHNARANALRSLIQQYDVLPYAAKHIVHENAINGALIDHESLVLQASYELLADVVKACSSLSSEAYMHSLQVLVKERCRYAGTTSSYYRTSAYDQAYHAAVLLLERVPDDACLDATVAALKDAPKTSGRDRFEQALGLVAGGLQHKQTRAQQAMTSSDVETLAILVDHANKHRDHALACTLMQNPALPTPSVLQLCTPYTLEQALDTAVARNDVGLANSVLNSTYGRSELLLLAVRHFGAALVVLMGGDYRLEAVLCENEDLHHLVDDYIAATSLAELVRNRYRLSSPIIAASVARQLARISPEAFRFASALQEGWEGSLNDLLNAVEAVQA